MECAFCGSTNVEVPTVDIGAGEQQCGPAECRDCRAAQTDDGRWGCPSCQAVGFAPRIGTTACGERFQGCEFCANEEN